MSDKVFSNDLDTRIKTAVQYMMCNLVSLNLSANTISFLIFKLEEIEYYNLKLDTQYDEKDIIIVEKNHNIER